LPGVVLFGIVALVLTGVGMALVGLVAGAVAGVLLSTIVWLGSAPLLLRSLRAIRTDDEDLPRAHNLVEGLCASMGLPRPAIWLVEDEVRDALALGRGPRAAALVLTSGLADTLDPVAMEGVLAHELTHIKRCDIASATVSAALLMPLATFVPGMGVLVHRLAGRGREFHTDRLAVRVTRYPPGLRDALSAMIAGPPPRTHSPLYRSAVARTTRWLWTVSLPVAGSTAPADAPFFGAGDAAPMASQEPRPVATVGTGEPAGLATPAGGAATWWAPGAVPVPGAASPPAPEMEVGELDAAPVRITALDEW
jgi:Zn-dependent protease with chaperone function